MSESNNEKDIECAINKLEGKTEKIQRTAVRALCAIWRPGAVEQFAHYCLELNSEEPYIYDRLKKFVHKMAISAFTDVLQKKVPLDPVAVLARMKRNISVPILSNLLKHNRNKYTRAVAARALGEIGNSSAVMSLAVASKDKHNLVRETVNESLDKLCNHPETVPILMRAFNTRNKSRRDVALRCFGQIRSPEAISVLSKKLRSRSAAIRRAAMTAIGKTQASRPVKELVEILAKNKDVQMRRGAAHLLGQIRSSQAAGTLIKAMNQDRDLAVRRIATEALGKIGRKKTSSMLARIHKVKQRRNCRG